jgi:hypothetical protein
LGGWVRPEAAFRNGALSPTGTVGHGGMTHTKELSEHPERFNTGFLRALIKIGFSSEKHQETVTPPSVLS